MMLNFKHSFKQSILGLLISALIVPGLQAGRSDDRYSLTTKASLFAVAALACYALYRYYQRPEMVYDAVPVLEDGVSASELSSDVVPVTDLINDATRQEAAARAKDAEQGVVWGEPIITGAKSQPAAVPAPVPSTVVPAPAIVLTGAHVAVPVAVRTGVSAAARQAANRDLFKACRQANLASASVAIAAGADINAVNTLDYTPLMLAVENNASAEVLQGLVNLGAHVSQANSAGQTVFYSLIGKPASSVVAALGIFNIALRAEMPVAADRSKFILERRYNGQTLMELAAINYNNDQRGSVALDGDHDQVVAALQALL